MTRYYAALCDGLRAQGAQVRVPLVTTGCDYEAGLARYTRRLRKIPRAAAVMDAASKRRFHQLVRQGDYDLVLATSAEFDADFLKTAPECRFVMVVHDLMSCVTAPDGLYDAAGPGLSALLYLARRASLVICVSEDTRTALMQHQVVSPERLRVVRTGNLLAATNLQAARINVPNRFLLFVGERSGRKGFFQLVRAVQPVMREDRDLHLVCTGVLRESEHDYIQSYGIADRVHAVPADDHVLVTLYSQALCLVYPSLYEGFGLPVIEAMSFGCPVITTHCGALKEIAGDSALCVDPTSLKDMTEAIWKVVNQASVRQELRKRGLSHSRAFGSEQMIRRFYLSFRSLLE